MFPWQTSNWNNLTSSQQNNRLAHGLLFHGAAGTGKNAFAIDFAHWLLCEQPLTDKACGKCKSCQLIQAESNPDLLSLRPEEEGKAIKVDQVRGLIEKISLTSHGKGKRVIIISPADALNVNASNSLLKTLEEPPANTVLILITDKPSKLVATIRSRTQMIRFDLPGTDESLQWLTEQNIENPDLVLKLSAGAPLAAKAMADNEGLQIRDKLFQNWQELASGNADALDSAAMWLKDGFKNLDNLPLNWMSSWLMDIIRSLQGGHIESMSNADYAKALQNLAGQVDLKSVYSLLDRLNDTIRLNGTSANQLMLIEGLLLHWAGLKRS
ncbi:MAG: DNA polymerase III subunit delta' [Gammaproteobacteria bacterium]|nr:DNA polymerase III subunit delta' [Gammaproteobacteria bacterium]MCW8988903.1 DNA polymerase III subunit delta' [Gammaproteobacteria bacterium]